MSHMYTCYAAHDVNFISYRRGVDASSKKNNTVMINLQILVPALNSSIGNVGIEVIHRHTPETVIEVTYYYPFSITYNGSSSYYNIHPNGMTVEHYNGASYFPIDIFMELTSLYGKHAFQVGGVISLASSSSTTPSHHTINLPFKKIEFKVIDTLKHIQLYSIYTRVEDWHLHQRLLHSDTVEVRQYPIPIPNQVHSDRSPLVTDIYSTNMMMITEARVIPRWNVLILLPLSVTVHLWEKYNVSVMLVLESLLGVQVVIHKHEDDLEHMLLINIDVILSDRDSYLKSVVYFLHRNINLLCKVRLTYDIHNVYTNIFM